MTFSTQMNVKHMSQMHMQIVSKSFHTMYISKTSSGEVLNTLFFGPVSLHFHGLSNFFDGKDLN